MVGGAAERGTVEGEGGRRCKRSHLQHLHWLSCQGDREKGACGDVPEMVAIAVDVEYEVEEATG